MWGSQSWLPHLVARNYSIWCTTRSKRFSAGAREQGKQVIPGIKMFIEQAVRQFEIWTGEQAPRAAMESAAAKIDNR
jgi:shikimate 5-dehydrogenase